MDLREKEKLDLVSIYDLMDNEFYIPDYQRGYRWTETEVKKLLQDLESFFSSNSGNGDSFYCMQPLVVYYNELEQIWEVIDGQQRLTTLFLILNTRKERIMEDNPDLELFSLSYQSRPNSKQFLENINTTDEKQANANIDFYHMYHAHKTIIEYFKNSETITLNDFISCVLNAKNSVIRPSVKFVWYNLTEEINKKSITPEEKFSDLNIGKISLTNAELVKALLLNELKENSDKKLRLASEWDTIEHSLHDENFWAFLYGKDDNKYDTRIELIFDILKNKDKSENSINLYYTFDKFVEDISVNKKKVEDIWKEISDCFYLFKSWYDDRKIYHIVGYLRHLKFELLEIIEIFNNASDYDVFYYRLKEKAIEETLDSQDIEGLSYQTSFDKKPIYNTLMLFNILSVLECEKSNVRFSFADFYQVKWDLEHIRSQTPKDEKGEDRRSWILCNLFYFTGVDISSYCTDDEYVSAIKESDSYQSESKFGKTTVTYVCDELIELLKNKGDVTGTEVYRILKEAFENDTDFEHKDNIGNLVLLDSQTNRGYGNAFFSVKRSFLNRKEKEGRYILPCTKNVFSKNYSSTLYDLMKWNNADAKAYTKEIERVLGIK